MSRLAVLQRYWHTLRYLKPVQFYGRVWQRLYRPRPRRLEAVPLRQAERRWQGCARAPTLLSPNRFRFLNVEREFTGAADWNRADWPKLWLYNLHYFDDLAAVAAGMREPWHRALIARWIAENPPAEGNGWEPYPISLRTVNWCKWLLQGREPVPSMLASLAIQADLLRRKPEDHLLGNHLWANYKALIFCGAIFGGERADGWLRFGLKGLRHQLAEQMLADGGHFERSPMYHATLLEDLLDLIQLAAILPGRLPDQDLSLWRVQAAAMLRWLAVMSHPDGRISLFNDAAFGIAPGLAALTAYARELDLAPGVAELPGVVDLPESGYCRLNRGGAVVLVDAAPIGPDYLPGHAHADTLSFEWSLDGHRVLVNGGTSTYQADEQRRLERSTAMHNTVEVDRQDSSEVWSAFRVARRARVHERKVEDRGDALVVSASHDGYERLPGRVRHQRQWQLGGSGLEIRDRLDGRWQRAVARFRFAPEVAIQDFDAHWGQLMIASRQIAWLVEGAGLVRLVDSTWHPEFGLSLPCKVLEVELAGPELVTRFEWN